MKKTPCTEQAYDEKMPEALKKRLEYLKEQVECTPVTASYLTYLAEQILTLTKEYREGLESDQGPSLSEQVHKRMTCRHRITTAIGSCFHCGAPPDVVRLG